MQPPNRARTHLLALSLYTALTLLLSWPLLLRLSTHVPGVAQWAFDESTFVWNIWTFKRAVVDQLSSPLQSDLIWYPLGIDLILYTYNFFHALIAQPLMLAFNLPLASNVALWMSTVLSGYGTFLLVRYLLQGAWRTERGAEIADQDDQPVRAVAYRSSLFSLYDIAAVVAGLVYAFAANRAVYAALGHYDMVTTQWIPFYALMLLRCLDGRLPAQTRRRAALLAGIFFAFNGLAEMITALFLAIFTLIVMVEYAGRMWRRSKRHAAHSIRSELYAAIVNLSLLALVAFLLWSPALLPILRQFVVNDFSLKGWGEAIPLSTDLLGWFTPTVLHPLYGADLTQELRRVQLRALEEGVTGFRDLNTVYLGWVTLLLAVGAVLAAGRRLRLWVWTTIVFGLFTLGPFLQINGRYQFDLDGVQATFPLPFALLHYIPVIKANRAPNRNSVILMLGLAVLVGYALFMLLQWLKQRRSGRYPLATIVAGALAALILFEHLALPIPLSDARVPAVYTQIAADPSPVSVLNVPLGWRNSFGVLGSERTQLQYYQTVHGKPMIGGNISRAPDFKMDYFARIPLFEAITGLEFGAQIAEETVESAQRQAQELAYLYNIGYVVLHPPIEERFPYADHWASTWQFVKETLPLEEEPFWQAEGIEAYRVRQPSGSDSFRLELGVPGSLPYRGEGWDAAEVDEPYAAAATWATADASRLFIPLRNVKPDATYRVQVRVHPFAYPGSPPQQVMLTVNGNPLSAQPLADEWQTLEWRIAGSQLQSTLNRITLHWSQLASPRLVLGGNRELGSTGVSLPVDVDLKAFADGGFIALFDEAGTQIDASAGRRGVNVTVLDAQSGTLIDAAGFDTTANRFESEQLGDYLAGLAHGRIVLVASYGDAWRYLEEGAINGLRNLGADVSMETVQNQYFVIAGVQGAAPGSAELAVGGEDAFLRISLNRDRRMLAAAVDWVEVQGDE